MAEAWNDIPRVTFVLSGKDNKASGSMQVGDERIESSPVRKDLGVPVCILFQ